MEKFRPVAPNQFNRRKWQDMGFGGDYRNIEFRTALRLLAGLNLRKVVSGLPRLTGLSLKHVDVYEPGFNFFSLYPWTRLE